MDQPLNTLHIINDLDVGGAEMMLYHFLSEHDPEGRHSNVLSMTTAGPVAKRLGNLQVPVQALGFKRRVPGPQALFRMAHKTRKLIPKILHGWMYHANLAASASAWFLPRRTPVIWSVHHSLVDINHEKPLTRHVIRLGRCLSRRASAIVYCSRVSARQHERLGFASERTMVIPNGIDCRTFQPDKHGRKKLVQKLGVPETGVVIGMLARQHPMKDYPNLIRAFARLSSHSKANVHLLLIGRGVTENNSSIEAAVRAAGVGDKVTLSEERDDLPEVLSGLDILALSSAWGEAFPITVGCAMASGVPAVVTDLGDCSWIVGDTGRIVPPRDNEALATGLQDLIARGKEGRARIGAAARRRVLENFSLATFVKCHRELYGEVLTSHGDHSRQAVRDKPPHLLTNRAMESLDNF